MAPWTTVPSASTTSAGTFICTRTVWRRCWLSHATAVATPSTMMLNSVQIRFITMVPGCVPSHAALSGHTGM